MQLEQRGDTESCQAHGAARDHARRRCFVFVEGHAVAAAMEAPAPSLSVKRWEGARGCVELGRGWRGAADGRGWRTGADSWAEHGGPAGSAEGRGGGGGVTAGGDG